MAYRIGIVGFENTGKSYSRKFIPDGENVMILAPSLKSTWLRTSDNKPCQSLEPSGKNFKNFEEARKFLKVGTNTHVIKNFLDNVQPGGLKRSNLNGNIAIVKDIVYLPLWLKFVDIHMPWIHTVILPDFTHFISEIISKKAFIDRKQGGDAFQKFWELAADALQSFILSTDSLRKDLMVVTEYHADFNENLGSTGIFSSGGKMLNEKFKPASYYDVMLYTHTIHNELGEVERYCFVTKPTKMYPQARCLDLFKDTYIDNDLNEVLKRVREHEGIPLPNYKEE
jgi:hypothetical protein